MPAVLLTGLTATQNSPFLPSGGQNQRYSLQRPTDDSQAEWAWVPWKITEWQTCYRWSPIPVLTEFDIA